MQGKWDMGREIIRAFFIPPTQEYQHLPKKYTLTLKRPCAAAVLDSKIQRKACRVKRK